MQVAVLGMCGYFIAARIWKRADCAKNSCPKSGQLFSVNSRPFQEQSLSLGTCHMAKSHCMSRHAARECSRGRAKKMATEPDETIKLLRMWSKEKLFLSFPWLTFETFHVLLWGWGGETYSCLIRRAHIADSRWGGDFFFYRWAACSSTRSTGRLGTTATFLVFPKPKKIMPQLRTTSLATLTGRGCSKTCRKSFVWQWQSTDFVVHRTPLKWKSSALSNHKQLAQLVYVK